MADPPRLRVSGIPAALGEDSAAAMSPARGAEMRNYLQSRLNQKNRAPPLIHSWDFWHDRQDRSLSSLPEGKYEDRLEPLAGISDVKQFWSVFNNFDISQLRLRDSVHLFHKGVKPVWEDARNSRGGSWTFRVPKRHGAEFWKEICMMAIGEQLQQAVDDPDKQTFRDDICGVSLGLRYNSMLVQIWNRDADHQAGIENILSTVLSGLSHELQPLERTYYYKKHSEHAGFGSTTAPQPATSTSQPQISGLGQELQSLDAVADSQ